MPEDQLEDQTIELVKAPDFKHIYSNHANFVTGVFDFSIIFGEIVEIDKAKQIAKVEQRVRIAMSPIQAKLFVSSFDQQIKAYEKNFGEIKMPDVLKASVQQAAEVVPKEIP